MSLTKMISSSIISYLIFLGLPFLYQGDRVEAITWHSIKGETLFRWNGLSIILLEIEFDIFSRTQFA